MSHAEVTSTDNATAETHAAYAQAGGMLKAAREAAGRSVGELATQLKVSTDKVEALEQGNWERLPDPAFARGLLRAAAKVLKSDPDAIMEVLPPTTYFATEPATKAATARPRRARPAAVAHRANSARKLWWIAVAIIVLAALLIFFYPRASEMQRLAAAVKRSGQVAVREEQVVIAPRASIENKPSVPAHVQEVSAPAIRREPAEGKTPVQTSPQPVPDVHAASSPAMSPSGGQAPSLSFQAAADSWVEVRNIHGKVLFSGIVSANTAKAVAVAEADFPLKLVVGDAGHTQVTFDGKPINLVASARSNVARVTVPKP